MKHGKKSNGTRNLIIILIVLIIIAGGYLAFRIISDNNQNPTTVANTTKTEEGEEEKQEPEEEKVKIFSGNDRAIAVMIDNHKGAWPQANLNKAYMVYEIIVEGGETRLMAVFKGQKVDKIGPVRSSRHYFIDYAMENDAIYAHFGWSPKAKADIKTYSINNINGITESSSIFWRVSDKYAPHNAVTSTEKLLKSAKSKNYRTTSTKESILNYTTKEVDLEDGETAQTITIPHSTLQKVTYKYDEKNQVYKRFARGVAQKDWTTGKAVTTKNIIITFCNNSTLNDSSGKGRQDLDNIGTFNGYYITNGKAIKIKCTKESRKSQTVYKDLEGNEIEVNDGNTFVNICPKSAKVTIK